MEFLVGIVCGVVLALVFSVGPAFFSLIQNSIHHGFRKTLAFVLGVSLSDITIVLLTLTVLSNVNMGALLHNIWVGSIGGIAIGIFGWRTYHSKVRKVSGPGNRLRFAAENATSRRQLLLSGFLLNFLNPLIWIYWLTIVTFLSAEMDISATDRYYFFAGLLLAVFGTDVLKCRLASMMQTWFTATRLNLFNKLTGSILMAFALYMIVSMVLYQSNPKIREKEDAAPQQSTRIVQTVNKRVNQTMHYIKRDSAQAETDSKTE